MNEKIWDVTVIGAGAAGLMAAIWARRSGADVLLLDGREKIGAKILMSGGTRCNVTNETITEKTLNRTKRKLCVRFSRDFHQPGRWIFLKV